MTGSGHQRARSVLAAADRLGYERVGLDGNGHHRFHHPVTGEWVSVPATPSDWRSEKNSVASLERLSGRKLPRQQHRRSRKNLRMEPCRPTVEDRAWVQETERLTRLIREEAERIRRDFYRATTGPTNRANAVKARGLINQYSDLEAQAAEHHLPALPPLGRTA